MNIYLHDIPLDQAQSCFMNALDEAGYSGILGIEVIPLDELAAGRVLAESVWAKLSSPHYHASAMDGFAVRAEEAEGASPSMPVTLFFGEQTYYVDTGDPLPDWANAVIPVENVEPVDDAGRVSSELRHPKAIRIRAAVAPWNHVRLQGEDIVASELVIPAGQVLRPVDLGALAAAGTKKIKVNRIPSVAILPTGSELVPIGEEVQKGNIIEFNSIILALQVNSWGGKARRFPIIPDDLGSITKAVKEAGRDHDLILLNAGSSAGSEDFSAQVIGKLGKVLVHGVAVRPGHPVILGLIDRTDGKQIPIIGIPGYPVSTALTAEIFIKPLISLWLGSSTQPEKQTIQARITRKIVSPAGDDDFLRVAVGNVNGKILAAPLARGAGMINTLVHADGIVMIPRGIQGLETGSEVTVNLYRNQHEIEHTIFAIGSHDLTLDILSQFLARFDRRLVSVNAGSQGGLITLQRGESHFGGTHLLDPNTGDYNLFYIRKYIPETPVSLIDWVGREQGLIVQKGNPKKIKNLVDLVRNDVVYINRQKGSGTRVLLDYHLQLEGIPSSQITGYSREEYTHLAVGVAVQSGRADCGLGIAAAAHALDIDFIPLFTERYQLVVPDSILDSHQFDQIINLAVESEFRSAIMRLPGYEVSHMGDLVCRLNQPTG